MNFPIKQILYPILMLSLSAGLSASDQVVKKSRSGICHDVSSPYYGKTTNYRPFGSLNDCLNSGGRLPKNSSGQVIASSTRMPSQSSGNRVLSGKGNTTNQSFSKAKKILERQVYFDHRTTFYCNAEFDERKNVIWPAGFTSEVYEKRSKRVEWEHVVPAENFGRNFSEWREGHPECVDSKGKRFKGRKCAEKMNTEYRFMQSDAFNLYPATGSVNALRQNYNFTQFSSSEESDFGSCQMKVSNRKVEPPVYTRGPIARTYLYMESVYPRYKMSKQQRQLMSAWDRKHPVTEWECERNKRITKLQGNKNLVVENKCSSAGYE